MDTKKTLYSFGVFNPNNPKHRIIRRFVIIFLCGGIITLIKNFIQGNPSLDDTDLALWTAIIGMLEKLIRENKE